MFGFSRYEMETTGSAERFPLRIEKFRKKRKLFPVLQHYFWWFVHNNITHFLIGILPFKPFFDFHDWSSVKLNAGEAAITTEIQELEAIKMQLEHIIKTLKDINDGEESTVSRDVEVTKLLIEDEIERYYDYFKHQNRKYNLHGTKKRKA